MFEVAGAVISVAAEGEWPGIVSAHRNAVEAWARTGGGRISVVVTQDGELRVGTNSITCRVSPIARPDHDVTLNPTLPQILRLRTAHSDEELMALGLLARIEEAERALAQKIESAGNALQELGDFTRAIREIVHREIYR